MRKLLYDQKELMIDTLKLHEKTAIKTIKMNKTEIYKKICLLKLLYTRDIK